MYQRTQTASRVNPNVDPPTACDKAIEPTSGKDTNMNQCETIDAPFRRLLQEPGFMHNRNDGFTNHRVPSLHQFDSSLAAASCTGITTDRKPADGPILAAVKQLTQQ